MDYAVRHIGDAVSNRDTTDSATNGPGFSTDIPASGLIASALALSRPWKRGITMGVDILLCLTTVWIAYYLRLDEWIVPTGTRWLPFVVSVALAIPIFIVSGLYRAIFRHSGAWMLLSIAQAVIVYGAIYATIFTIGQLPTVPRTIGIIQPLLMFVFVSTSRVTASWWLGGAYHRILHKGRRQNVVIYGAGMAGRQLFRALVASEMDVVGFIDDDLALQGRHLFRRRIFSPAKLPGLVERYRVTDVLLAFPSQKRRRKEISSQLEHLGVTVRSVPVVTDLAQGRVEVSDRDIDINALLGRKAVAPNEELLARNITGKTVLVTGAGGSIGSELCRQILRMRPNRLLLVDFSEIALYTIHQELEHSVARIPDTELVPLLASICDEERMRGIIAAWQPDTIYHAAAYKHVPLVEHNPIDGIWNNVFGTMTIAQLAQQAGVGSFVFVSTDKAVRPTNIMGATKRLAELVLQGLASMPGNTCFSMVRFGNVLGSSGSVVPLFKRQIAAGGPITITDIEITRYFMTIPEASQLVIQAGAMASGGDVFVLDMGEPVKIVDLARNMIRLSGFTVSESESDDGDIAIKVVGLRPGEKLYEELLIGNDPEETEHSKIMKASEHTIPWDVLKPELMTLKDGIDRRDIEKVMTVLRTLVVEYTPRHDVVDWVHMRHLS